MIPTRTRLLQVTTDALAFTAAFALAYAIRFDWQPTLEVIKLFLFQLPYVVGFETLVLYGLGAHRLVWRFISLKDAWRLVSSVFTASAALLLARLVAGAQSWGYWIYARVPLGVIAINFLVAGGIVVGARVLRRVLYERSERRLVRRTRTTKRVLLIGAGRAGQLVAKEISGRADLGLTIVGFIDDDPAKAGAEIQGVRVLGTSAELPTIAAKLEIAEAIIAMAQVDGSIIRRMVERCKDAAIPAKIMPGLYEIIGGRVSVSRLRDVQIEDLLGRDPVQLDSAAVTGFLQHKIVVITGAGGSIGAELARQVCGFRPARLLLVERSENALFEIHAELMRGFGDLPIVPYLADVGDRARMRQLLVTEHCDVLFHAAAHKHVPMMETNPTEAVKNNILATQQLADLAEGCHVGRFVLISTDKAVNPTSIMGASKRVAELYLQGLARRGARSVFVAVRFGNVLGSNGSVIPIFRRQIAAGGPVTVTHPEMRRYFMTIPEAAQLVLQAAALGEGGEVFILDMGQPVRIVDLAYDMIRLSGLEPGRDIAIEYTGVRPGEKLFEELATGEESAAKTRHDKIFIARVRDPDWQTLVAGLRELAAKADELDPQTVRRTLHTLIPEFAGDAQLRQDDPSATDAASG